MYIHVSGKLEIAGSNPIQGGFIEITCKSHSKAKGSKVSDFEEKRADRLLDITCELGFLVLYLSSL